jgi:hypothetical protein
MLFCSIAVLQCFCILCQCGALVKAFTIRCVASPTISKSLTLINGHMFHMYSFGSLPVAHTRRIMSEWPNRCMLRLLETADQSLDAAWSCHCHFGSLWFLYVTQVCSGCIIIARASGLGMEAGMFSHPLRGEELLPMLDAGLDTMRRVESACEVPPGAGVRGLLALGVAVGVHIDSGWVVDGVDATCWVMSATRELFSEDEVVEFRSCIVLATELPPWKESLLPAGTETHLLAEGSSTFPKQPLFCWFWQLARLWTFHVTRVLAEWGLWEACIQYSCSILRMWEWIALHTYATASKVDSYLCDQGRIWQKGRRSVNCARLQTVTIFGDKIPWEAFNYGVHCHQIKLGINSALIFTVRAMSDGLFTLLEGYSCLLSASIIVLHWFLAQYFEPSIVYIISFPADVPLRQS